MRDETALKKIVCGSLLKRQEGAHIPKSLWASLEKQRHLRSIGSIDLLVLRRGGIISAVRPLSPCGAFSFSAPFELILFGKEELVVVGTWALSMIVLLAGAHTPLLLGVEIAPLGFSKPFSRPFRARQRSNR